jgi:hypothetical protein
VLPPESEAEVTVSLDASPETVWRVLTRPETSGARIEKNDDGSWVEDLGIARIEVRDVESIEPTRLVRELRDASIPMRARWTIELEQGRVRARNETRVDRGSWRAPLFRFLMRVMNGPRRALVHYFRRLGGSLGVRVEID